MRHEKYNVCSYIVLRFRHFVWNEVSTLSHIKVTVLVWLHTQVHWNRFVFFQIDYLILCDGSGDTRAIFIQSYWPIVRSQARARNKIIYWVGLSLICTRLANNVVAKKKTKKKPWKFQFNIVRRNFSIFMCVFLNSRRRRRHFVERFSPFFLWPRAHVNLKRYFSVQ